MNTLQEFVSTFFEAVAFMILWSRFNLYDKMNFQTVIKNFIISILIALVVVASHDIVGSYYGIGISYIFMTFIISFGYKKNIINIFVEICTNMILLMIIELIIMCPLKLFKFSPDSFSFSIIISVILCIVCTFIFIFWPKNKLEFINKINHIVVNYLVINLALYMIICRVLWQYDSKLLLNNSVIFICILVVIFILNLFLCHYVVKINEKNKAMEVNSRYIPIIKNMTEDIRQKQHEFKNHLNAMAGMVQVSEGEELKNNLLKYIKSVDCSTESIEKIAYIDNLILRAIIYSKFREAEIKGINFSYNVSNDLCKWKIEDYELSEILTNILNNAFEEVINNGNKVVILNIYRDNNINIIKVKNTVKYVDEINLKKIFKRGFSTKKGKNRGYGLYNTKKIVESNEGKIHLSLEDNYICFKILL